MITITPMEETTVDFVTALSAECFSMPWSREAIAGQLQNPHALTLIAWEDGVPCGFVDAYSVLDEGYVNHIAVMPAFRHRGIGQALLAALCAAGEERSLAFWSLEVRASNASAIRFYESAGFLLAGRREDFYEKPREAALLYTKTLSGKGTVH